MATYDVPDVGRVNVTVDRHEFGNSDTVLKTLGNVHDENGAVLPFETWEKVNKHLQSIGVVN
ncbi:hypothetical protein [Microbacterium sp. NPDC089696]|uniref:hypothetical protein n=1 Tax=Microbacterium sp. NPDC089696 TaxID=3364199 RepID=UPI0037FB52E7